MKSQLTAQGFKKVGNVIYLGRQVKGKKVPVKLMVFLVRKICK